ncbi:MAG: alpha/beta hydrolase [Deltaproteobacteria bacterium]|nr:alpha/beta hydrolase [Deltaproteobacteria bacterium]
MSFSTIGKYKLAYRLKRGGPDSFVFIHGLGASKNSFDRCFGMRAFSGYTLAAIDLPGCGGSSQPDDFSYSMKDQADLVLTWIRDLALDRMILVGHSMGGVICLYLAEALGAQVKAFFNLEGNLHCEDCTFSGKVASGSWEDFESKGFEEFKSALRKAVQKKSSPGLKNYYQNISKAYPRALYLSSVSLVKESYQGNLKQRFLDVPVKKWYVFGEKSMNQPTRSFLDANKIPYFIVPESGHFMMDDQPGLFYKMLFEALGDKKRGEPFL